MQKYHSQFGEDRWIVENINPPVGFFLDIGASDGIYLSNTFYFEQMGWDGICFEPNQKSYPRALGVRKMVLPHAIGKENKKVTFNLDIVEPDLSGLNKYDRQYKEHTVDMYTLDTIIKTYNITKIDLLSIDTEGTELDVLNSFDIAKIPPKIIIVEHFNQHRENVELKDFFADLPYTLKLTTVANCIYQLNS